MDGKHRYFDEAIVPDSLRLVTIGSLSSVVSMVDVPILLPVSDSSANASWFDSEPLYVDKEIGKLMADKEYEVSDLLEDQDPTDHVVLMATSIKLGEDFKSFLIADLRFIDGHTIPIENLTDRPTNEEEAEDFDDLVSNSLPIDGFIARYDLTDEGSDDEGDYSYYGPDYLRSALDKLADLANDAVLTAHSQPSGDDKLIHTSDSKTDDREWALKPKLNINSTDDGSDSQ